MVGRDQRSITPESCEEHFRLILDNISDAVYVLDTKGRFVFVNRVMTERSQISSGGFLGRHFVDFLDPKDRKNARERFQKIMEGQKVAPFEVEYRAGNGKRIWVEVNSRALCENGRIVGSIGISRDIRRRQKEKEELEQRVKERTEALEAELRDRELAQKALRKSEQKFRELSELLPDVVFEANREGMLTYTNRAGFETFGYSREEFEQGVSAYLIIAEEDRQRLKKNVERLMKGRTLGLGQYLCVRKDGTAFPAFIHSSPIVDDGGSPVGLRGILVDVSAEKRAEEERLHYQGHMSTLASELSLAEERVRRHTAMELHDTVAQIMAFAKMKLGVLRKSVPEVSLKKNIDEVLDLVEDAIANTRGIMSELISPILYEMGLVPAIEWLGQRFSRQHGMIVKVEKDREPDPLVFDVKILLFQIVRELLLNVVKHAAAEKAQVTILNAGQNLRVSVEDDGIGFDLDTLPALREKTTNHFGLFSVKVRVESIGGKFMIRTSPGKGTAVSLTVPFSGAGEEGKGGKDDHPDRDCR